MDYSPRVTIVASNKRLGTRLGSWLSSRGYDVAVVKDFAAARRELDEHPPTVLVTELKLGEYNGLHLAVRTRARFPGTPAIVIGDGDHTGLDAEARQLGAQYLANPLNEHAFTEVVSSLCAASNHGALRASA
jgi:DNA-binding response OmpR family regulator